MLIRSGAPVAYPARTDQHTCSDNAEPHAAALRQHAWALVQQQAAQISEPCLCTLSSRNCPKRTLSSITINCGVIYAGHDIVVRTAAFPLHTPATLFRSGHINQYARQTRVENRAGLVITHPCERNRVLDRSCGVCVVHASLVHLLPVGRYHKLCKAPVLLPPVGALHTCSIRCVEHLDTADG